MLDAKTIYAMKYIDLNVNFDIIILTAPRLDVSSREVFYL